MIERYRDDDMSDENEPKAPKKTKAAAKPKADAAPVVETDEDADDYVAPRSRARLARAERLARIGGDA